MKFLVGLMLLGSLSSVYAETLNGPVGTACTVTTNSGTTMNGSQGWSAGHGGSGTNAGHWTCCQAGTSCSGKDRPERIVGTIDLGDSSVPVKGRPTARSK